MEFKVISRNENIQADKFPQLILRADNWNDWFEFYTLFHLYYFDSNENRHALGAVKIAIFDMTEEKIEQVIPNRFDCLDKSFFSLGQDVKYYEAIKKLGDESREAILLSLRDVSFDKDLLERALSQRVMKESLLRSVSLNSVRNQFSRIAHGGDTLSIYEFKYVKKSNRNDDSIELEFKVTPHEYPPSNIHVLIGRNGVGKTYLLNNMINSLINKDTHEFGYFISNEEQPGRELFSNLVAVSFSAFDNSTPIPNYNNNKFEFRYSYIGLKEWKESSDKKDIIIEDKFSKYELNNTEKNIDNSYNKSIENLTNDFVDSLKTCIQTGKGTRWKNSIKILESDPMFKESDIRSVIDNYGSKNHVSTTKKIFTKLSSGHKIILLTLTKLVEYVEERSLVLLDEPEAHLHPPLLSAFTRALSDLLMQRNGVAIIATHSPVVLQEVPSNCVWKIRRTGFNTKVERLENESFGASIDTLTREVFGLEVTHAGFHRLISEVVNKVDDYEDAIAIFNNKLGFEARVIMRNLFEIKNLKDDG